MDEPRFHPLDYVSVIRRRKWWFIVPLSVSVLTGALLALFLPREYRPGRRSASPRQRCRRNC